jgi:pimeloyl-ACP methyl ester carboxylesterase
MTERLDVPVDGGSLAVFRFGEPAERPIVAIHGITANSQAWRAVAQELAPEVSVLAVDLRGRGQSAGLPGPYGLAAHARDLLAVLDHLGLEQAVLVGHSLGAYIAVRFAAEHPERVTALVLVDGGLSQPLPSDVDRQAIIDTVLGSVLARLRLTFESTEAYRDWWREHPAFAHGQVADAVLTPYADHDLIGEPPALRPSVTEAAVRADSEDVLDAGTMADRLRVPATLLRAPRGLLNEERPVQPAEMAAAWAEKAPDQRQLIDVSDVNHYTLVMGAGASAVAGVIRASALDAGAIRTGLTE